MHMLVLKGGMADSSDHGSAAKESAIDLEVTGSGPVGCHFPIPSSFLSMFSSLTCLSYVKV